MNSNHTDEPIHETERAGTSRPVILVVDDDASLREFLDILFSNEGYRVLCAADAAEALRMLDAHPVSLVVSDVKMPGMDGVTLLREIKGRRSDIPVILITAFASLDTAVAAMKEGAWDYLTKPFRIDEIREIVEQALQAKSTSGETAGRDERAHRLDQMVTQSPAMLKIFQLIPKIADSPSSVLITGESGTGKELIARAIHNLGTRTDRPFVVVNCGSIPENLLESELFGHSKGAFTGAEQEKGGLLAAANGGSVFLDEIGELPAALQVKLLRVVQQKAFTPVGSTREIHVDIRIIAATNRNLEEEVMAGRFREDLYYRLNVIHIRVPPLRERPEDIPLLVQYFLDRFAKEQGKTVQGISSYAVKALMEYPFPGNVRELENIIERSVAMADTNLILPESLSLARFKQKEASQQEGLSSDVALPPEGIDLEGFLSEIEKRLLIQALERAGGVKTEAARLLGLNFRSFRYRLAKYAL